MKLSPNDRQKIDNMLSLIAMTEAGPSKSEISDAPFLDDWGAAKYGPTSVCLFGVVSGHPVLNDGLIITSKLIAIYELLGWVRTASRWYRLGQLHLTLRGASEINASTSIKHPIFEDLERSCEILHSPREIKDVLSGFVLRIQNFDRRDRAQQGNNSVSSFNSSGRIWQGDYPD